MRIEAVITTWSGLSASKFCAGQSCIARAFKLQQLYIKDERIRAQILKIGRQCRAGGYSTLAYENSKPLSCFWWQIHVSQFSN